MSGGMHIRDEGGTGVALRSRPVEQSGKFSSILAYLDLVSDDVSRQHRGQRINDHETVLLGSGSSSPSSISSSEQQQSRRRPRQQPRGPSQSSYRRNSGVSRVSAAGTRAPWNNSVKDDKTPTATSSAPPERSTKCRASGGHDLRGPPFGIGDTTCRDNQNRTASTPSARSHPRRHVVNHRRSVDVSGGFLSVPDANHVAGGGEWSSIDDFVKEAPDDRTATRTEAATATVGGKPHRQRWVWDEWDDNEAGTSTSCRESKQPVAPRASLSEKTSPGRASNSSSATPDETSHPVADHDRTTRLSTWGRDKDRAAANADGGEATPAAMKAFEDVQATARAMKVNLKERRSEVC